MTTLADLWAAETNYNDTIISFTTVEMATEPQIKYLKHLIGERHMNNQARAYALASLPNLTKFKASEEIIRLKKLDVAPIKNPAKPAVKIVDGPGMYVGGSGTVYSYKYKKGSQYTNFYKLFITVSFPDGERKETGRFAFIKWSIAKKDIEDGGRKLTEAEAQEFGHKHSFCMCCGKELNNTKSVALGIGPHCRAGTVWA